MRKTIIDTLKDIFSTALVSLAIFLFIYTFVVQPHRVKGDSMLPNFYDGELLLTEKISYRFSDPARGDIIVFKAPGSRNVDYIKRVIGLPGENIRISDGEVFVNGEKIYEPYETQKTRGSVEITMSEDQYFVLGDNRGSSSDSRSFGPINKSTINGRTWVVYWPISKSKEANGIRIFSRVDYRVPDSFDNL